MSLSDLLDTDHFRQLKNNGQLVGDRHVIELLFEALLKVPLFICTAIAPPV